MAKVDYSKDDDYYNQDFERENFVSIWLGLCGEDDDLDADVLQDMCGVGYYNVDEQESNFFDFELVSVEKLIGDLSYSNSFIEDVVEAARKKGIVEARWVTAQYDFDYDPAKVSRAILQDPIYIGSFPYLKE